MPDHIADDCFEHASRRNCLPTLPGLRAAPSISAVTVRLPGLRAAPRGQSPFLARTPPASFRWVGRLLTARTPNLMISDSGL
mmetsp:Transcript_106822/g.207044  ORF Transcript_106822/g.207044 Transcript_106822/m.207044 type:complete len:82 (-) Transcript_106822:525-770(-)